MKEQVFTDEDFYKSFAVIKFWINALREEKKDSKDLEETSDLLVSLWAYYCSSEQKINCLEEKLKVLVKFSGVQ